MPATATLPPAVSERVPLVDLRAQHAAIGEKIEQAVRAVFQTQQFILGPAVEECERRIAEYCRCAHGVGTSSGTDALLACLMAERIETCDEVLTSPFASFAAASAIARTGAVPVFVDIQPDSYTLDPEKLGHAVNSRTKAIIPVHLFGQCAAMAPILEIAARNRLAVIEDAAQAIGAETNGRRAGSMGHYGCLSFHPMETLGGAGDGGMVVTQDGPAAERLAVLRVHADRALDHEAQARSRHALLGGNFRLDAIQAAILVAKLPSLDTWIAARQANAERYRRLFAEEGLMERGLLHCPHPSSGGRHTFSQFVIRAARRDELQAELARQGIDTAVYCPVPMHLQPCFQYLGYHPGDFPESERAAQETLSLPIYPELEEQHAMHIVTSIARFYQSVSAPPLGTATREPPRP